MGRPAAATALAALLAGCAGDHSGAWVGPAAPLPDAPRVIVDDPAAREHAQLVKAFGGEVSAPQLHALLSTVTGRLVAATDRPAETYQITILDSPIVNAFALPSGRLYVTRGLLALASDAAEAAAVLAHEIAHVTLRHASARTEVALRSALVSRVVSDVLKDPAGGAMLQDQSRFTIASFSRAQELEADQVSVGTLAKAGFDPYGASRFLNALGRQGGLGRTEAAPAKTDMLSTHPGTPERIVLALQAARRIGAPGLGESDRAAYLAALDGLAYGDSPTDGVVRGHRFLHPRLGVAFEAPEGFVLDNTARAVLGATADGAHRLLFDAVEAPSGQSLEALLQESWAEDIAAGSVESLTVNGFPAAVASSRGRDWSIRLAAVRVGATTYRLVLAGRKGGADLDRAFRNALNSVRALGADEAQTLQPLRIRLVTAKEGDTAETLAARMGTDRPLDRFLVLNGLDGAVRPGEVYKIAAE